MNRWRPRICACAKMTSLWEFLKPPIMRTWPQPPPPLRVRPWHCARIHTLIGQNDRQLFWKANTCERQGVETSTYRPMPPSKEHFQICDSNHCHHSKNYLWVHIVSTLFYNTVRFGKLANLLSPSFKGKCNWADSIKVFGMRPGEVQWLIIITLCPRRLLANMNLGTSTTTSYIDVDPSLLTIIQRKTLLW